MLYLFWPELLDVASGRKPYQGELKSLVGDRRQYFDHWHARRSEMPKVLGTIPEAVEDPMLIEIFGHEPGVDQGRAEPGRGQADDDERALPRPRAAARGIARVLQSSDELHRLEPG